VTAPARKPPSHVWVSWCATCDEPIAAGLTRAGASCSGCKCPVGQERVEIARYRLDPGKKRNGRKPRRIRR
jgi:hypothetical protein